MCFDDGNVEKASLHTAPTLPDPANNSTRWYFDSMFADHVTNKTWRRPFDLQRRVPQSKKELRDWKGNGSLKSKRANQRTQPLAHAMKT